MVTKRNARWQWPIVLNILVKPINERQMVTAAVFGLALILLGMARENPSLWDVELFKILLQAVIISGLVGSILAFHFAANKDAEHRIENTGKAFDAITATASATGAPTDIKQAAVKAADKVADAAVVAADKVADAAQTKGVDSGG